MQKKPDPPNRRKRVPLGERRKRIVVAARELFVSHGYDGTSLDEVISRAGGSRRDFYNEFGGKPGLLNAVVEEIIQEIATTAERIPPDTQSPREWLVHLGEAFALQMLSPEVTAVFRQLIAQGGVNSEAAEKLWTTGPDRFRALLRDWLQEQSEKDNIRVNDPELVARVLPEMFKASFQFELLVGRQKSFSQDEIKAHVEKCVDLFLFLED